jgi:hypothetical protein
VRMVWVLEYLAPRAIRVTPVLKETKEHRVHKVQPVRKEPQALRV